MHCKIYTYAQCSTCRTALKYLAARGIPCENIPIREQPPSLAELRRMLGYYGGKVQKLFNTSGRDYQSMGLKSRLPTLPQAEALALLAHNGNLVKRPFLLTPHGGRVGFREAEWASILETVRA